MEFIQIMWLFALYTVHIQASTHWMVTETGLIQPRIDSPFEMARPYDLLAFLNQDTRWDSINNLYHDLHKHQKTIDTLWSDLEVGTDILTILSSDENCAKSGQLTSIDWYTAFLEDGKSKGISDDEFQLQNSNEGFTDVPDCKKISSLTFSMFAFEHLEGLVQRENLTANPELSLPERISQIMTVDQFGHWLTDMLKKNSSSWLHYNMASLYWRVKGNAAKALECSRRAVHYAPREYKDIALLSMGSILHRSKLTEDAIVVLGAATDHDPHYPYNHFVLANAYAINGDFNSSIKHYDQCLDLNPNFDLATKYKHAILCHIYLGHKIDILQETLKKLRHELLEYSGKENEWLKCQSAFLRAVKHTEEFDYKNVEKNCERMSELTGLNTKELKQQGDKNSLIQYFLDSPLYNDKWFKDNSIYQIESAYSLQRLVKHINKHTNMVSSLLPLDQIRVVDGRIVKEIGQMPVSSDALTDLKGNSIIESVEVKVESHKIVEKQPTPRADDDHFEFDTGLVLYPTTMKIHRNQHDFDIENDWPSNRVCLKVHNDFSDNIQGIYPVFLPFENKGLRMSSLLTDKIGVPASVEHELPWHPPTCPQDKDAAAFTQKKGQKPQFVREVIATDFLRHKLYEYVSDGDMERVKHMQDAEIGQRIYTAMQMESAPKWLLYTLASLYWRVRGNNINALHCIQSANKKVDTLYRDIVLVSLASVYLEMGYFDESLSAAEEAFRLSLYEPATNFILAELNMIKKHRNTHMFHLKQVIRVDPGFMGGVGRHLLNAWGCVFKESNTIQNLELNEGDVCTQVEAGMSVICEKEGTNCHMTNVQCFTSSERDTNTIVKMLEIRKDSKNPERLDENLFDLFTNKMPTDRTDKEGHQKNYDFMVYSIDRALKGCELKGCLNIKGDYLSLKRNDCNYQRLQLGYWLHIISFRQLLSDSELRLPLHITSVNPSNKKIPECQLPEDPQADFFMERIINLDLEGWEPILSLMHQFADMFSFYDYVSLGAKLAKYVDAKPTSWVALAAAGWWCGAGGRSACATVCFAAAFAHAPPPYAAHALATLSGLLHMQSKHQDGKDMSYLAFYLAPKNKLEAFLVAVSHTYLAEYELAVWMYGYSLTFDEKFLPAKACLHATTCLMLFGENYKYKVKDN